MAKATRGGKRASVADTVTEVVVQSGDTADLTGFPLTYGEKDEALQGKARQAIEDFEEDHRKRKSEYCLLLDKNGQPIFTNKGGRGSVKIPLTVTAKATVMTHVHPRGKGDEGCLGGTFSDADIKYFNMYDNLKTMRASAAEGVYSITKGDNFDKKFSSYMRTEAKTAERAHIARQSSVYYDYVHGKITYTEATQKNADSFNQYMVDCHNSLLNGQKKYGYTYRLERWGS